MLIVLPTFIHSLYSVLVFRVIVSDVVFRGVYVLRNRIGRTDNFNHFSIQYTVDTVIRKRMSLFVLLNIVYLAVLQFCEKWVFSAMDCWGLVRAMKQSLLSNGSGWTKAWRGPIWHWLPPDKQTQFMAIVTAIVKLMTYVSNQLQWLQKKKKNALRECIVLT